MLLLQFQIKQNWWQHHDWLNFPLIWAALRTSQMWWCHKITKKFTVKSKQNLKLPFPCDCMLFFLLFHFDMGAMTLYQLFLSDRINLLGVFQQETIQRVSQKYNPGGYSHLKVVQGCAADMTPFFQANRRSLAYQFTINVPLMCPPCSSFGIWEFFAFLALFWPKF